MSADPSWLLTAVEWSEQCRTIRPISAYGLTVGLTTAHHGKLLVCRRIH